MEFKYSAQIRFSDTDAIGHINHAKMLAYLEDARVQLFARISGSVGGSGGVIIARLEIDYRSPLYLSPEPATVAVEVAHVGTKSFTLAYRIEHENVLIAEAKSVLVAYDYAAGRTRELTESERTALQEYS